MLKRENYGIWVLGALLAVLVLIVATSTGSDRSILITALGHGAYVMALWLVLLTAVPMWWRSVKKGGRAAFTTSAVALPIVALCGWLLVTSQSQSRSPNLAAQKQNIRSVASNMQATLSPANAPKLTQDNRAQRLQTYANSPTSASGSLGNSQREVKTFVAKALALRTQFTETSARVQWDYILDPARIAADKEMAQSAVMVDAMKQAAKSYVDGMHNLIDGLPPDLGASMSQRTKDLMFESLSLQQQETNQVGDVIQFLTETKGLWTVGKKQILFQRQSDSDKYNQYLHNLFVTDAKLQSVEAERLKLGKQGLQKMQQLAK